MPAKVPRRGELGDFLRSRRERLDPEKLHIVSHGRRRTPGLRREEVCDRAKVGISWYTWLEQGREVNLTSDILLDVTHALDLSTDEAVHAFELAGLQPPPPRVDLTLIVPQHLQTLLDVLEPNPAYILNGRWDRIAWNRGALLMWGEFAHDLPRLKNSVWNTFNNPDVRGKVNDWESYARILLAEFAASRARFLQEHWMQDFISEMKELAPEFSTWWEQKEVSYSRDKKLYMTFDDDVLSYHMSCFEPCGFSDLTLVTLIPEPGTPTLSWLKQKIMRGEQS